VGRRPDREREREREKESKWIACERWSVAEKGLQRGS